MVKSNSIEDMIKTVHRITELTTPVRGSMRFGTIGGDNKLYMFVGPIPEVYFVGSIPIVGKRKNALAITMKDAANAAQDLMTLAYDIPREIRGTNYESAVEFIRTSCGFGG